MAMGNLLKDFFLFSSRREIGKVAYQVETNLSVQNMETSI
jgi:hypothetical protein